MVFKWSYYMSLICFLSFYTKLTMASGILQPLMALINSNANKVSTLGGSNSSLAAYDHYSANEIQVADENSSTQNDTEGLLPQRPDMFQSGIFNHEPNTTHYGFTTTSASRKELLDSVNVSNFTFLPNLTSSENLTNADMDNSTQFTMWNHLTDFTHYLVHHKYIGDKEQKGSGMKKFFGAHKLLALFLGMAGVLACLFILVYCIYIRQHKEDMFSHHRLYGEGFEDPVLHLDTPVDHLDFFSFRDTEFTPASTPQHQCQKLESYESNGDYRVDAPKGTSSNEHLQQIIQMGPIKFS
ncbi:Golgi-associated olfactory signaling regulator isoform X2 [Pseudophryne corroboree]|uniref:Golgi-associated olfactory signaling regulator isoform X2 n=1 Tax=Pseudophryne corroboree TaxID=495146 RepID=UPI0030817DD4